jgi:phenylpropionate dioxygenase-like ring-hydroxylating dioxygenase large terminal subunit
MASPLESEILTRVGPGTAMGELMRQYWLPAAGSRELVAGAAPTRLMLLGEKLIAFRDSAGRVGIMDHRCPHRCASLFYGRSEEGGLRCVYHGWKFDVDGNCLEMPNVPPEYDYRDKVKAKSYKVIERNGLIWVYMGPRAEPPALPALEPTLLPAKEMMTFFCQRECNWLQGLEGDIDTSHFSFLHAGTIDADDIPAGNMARHALVNRSPNLSVAKTEWGTVYGARRISDGRIYWRFAPFAFPFWTMPPEGDFDRHLIVRAWVPMDDTHTMFVHLSWKENAPRPRQLRNGQVPAGFSMGMEFLSNTSDWYGRWRLAQNQSNDYRIDREVQRTRSFTGIEGIHVQDQAITESMGEIVDHGHEHLGHSDLMVIQTRRRLIQAALDLKERGVVPPGVDDPEVYLQVHAGDFLIDEEKDFLEAYRTQPRTWVDREGRVHPPNTRDSADKLAAAAK